VIDRGAGDYEAGFAIAGNVWSRFKWDGPSGTVYSAPFVVTPQRSSAWMFRYGIGDVGKRSMGFGPNWSASLPAEVRTTAPVQVLGTLLVQTTQDGLTWVNAQAGSRYSTYAKSLSATAAPTPLTWDTYFTTVNTTLRLAWQANDWSDATASGPMTYLSWAPASTPKVAYKQSTRRKVVVTGKTPGPNVIVTLFRLKGRTWRKTGTYRLTNRTGTPGAIPYSLRLKLGKGKYAVRATNGADSIHTESPMSGMGLFLVK
jgi:hypothetical protein